MPNQFLNPNDQQSVNNYVDLRTALVLTSITEVNNLDAGTAPALIYEGKVYARDPNDTTSVADNVNVIEDRNGTRFKAFLDRVPRSVIGNQVSPPPNAQNNLGDAYLVFGAGATTGDFNGQRENIAIWTPWQWRFIIPPIGTRIFHQADQQNYYFDGNIWRNDIISLQNNTVDPTALNFRNTIVQRIENNPPAVIPNEEMFLIGLNPTGVWVAHANDIAYGNGTTWEFISPRDGELVYNRALNSIMVWENGAWQVVREDSVIQNRLLGFSSNEFTPHVFGTQSGWSLFLTNPIENPSDILTWQLNGFRGVNPLFSAGVRRTATSAGAQTEQVNFVLGFWVEDSNNAQPDVRVLATSPPYTANRTEDGANYRWDYSGEIEFKRSPAEFEQIRIFDYVGAALVPVGKRVRIGIVTQQAGYAPQGAITDTSIGMFLKIERQVL